MEWPLGGKAEQEVKCDSAFHKYFHLSGCCGRFVGNCQDYKGTLTSTCKATFLFVIVFLVPTIVTLLVVLIEIF